MVNNLRGCKLRKGRISIPGQIYLVTTVTRNRQSIFSDFALGRLLVHEFMQSAASGRADTLAFVIMPDHLHWLLSLGSPISLSSIVENVKSHSARRINRRRCSAGKPVWQRGFHDHALRREESVIDVARYIVANPVRAGLVGRVGDYPLWDAVWL